MRYLGELSKIRTDGIPRIFIERCFRDRFYRFYTVRDYFVFELEQVGQMRGFIKYSAYAGGLE